MLDKLHALGTRRLMMVGGGTINWSFLQIGPVDERSSIIALIPNGDPEAKRFFTAREPYSSVSPVGFRLAHDRRRECEHESQNLLGRQSQAGCLAIVLRLDFPGPAAIELRPDFCPGIEP